MSDELNAFIKLRRNEGLNDKQIVNSFVEMMLKTLRVEDFEKPNIPKSEVKKIWRNVYTEMILNGIKEFNDENVVLEMNIGDLKIKLFPNSKENKSDNSGSEQKELYQWVCENDKESCKDCKERHGQTETMEVWELIGLPASGFSECNEQCRCMIEPVTK